MNCGSLGLPFRKMDAGGNGNEASSSCSSSSSFSGVPAGPSLVEPLLFRSTCSRSTTKLLLIDVFGSSSFRLTLVADDDSS
jgi:hypothetical protein